MKTRDRIHRRLVAAVSTVGLFAAGAAAQTTGGDAEAGRRLFMSNGCYACHGTVGQGGERSGGPRLAPDPYPYEAIRAIVRHPPEAMPRFDPEYLTDEQLQSIHAYLASIPKGPGAKDVPQLQAR